MHMPLLHTLSLYCIKSRLHCASQCYFACLSIYKYKSTANNDNTLKKQGGDCVL